MLIYATPTDLVVNGWMSTPPTNAGALLRRASLLVREATKSDLYWTYPLSPGQPIPIAAAAGTDPGKPVDPLVSQAFNDATCQQVLEWATAGINPDAGMPGQPLIASQQTVQGGAATYDVTRAAEWLQDAVENLCEASMTILRNVGLAVNRPQLL